MFNIFDVLVKKSVAFTDCFVFALIRSADWIVNNIVKVIDFSCFAFIRCVDVIVQCIDWFLSKLFKLFDYLIKLADVIFGCFIISIVFLEQKCSKSKHRINVIYFNYMTYGLKLKLLKTNGEMIAFCNNPTQEMQLIAVRQNGSLIRFIKNPSEEVKLEAVKQDGNAIQYIKQPSYKVKRRALQQNLAAFKFCQSDEKIFKFLKFLHNKNNKKINWHKRGF